jgi:WD40 repeat protein/tRNA A-37 threonylcarbamoyl transferase component Bud32
MSSDTSWFHARGEEKRGPFTWGQLRDQAASGELLPEEMVLQQGDSRWFPARDVAGLFVRTSGDVPEQCNTVSFAVGAPESPTVTALGAQSDPPTVSPGTVTVPGYELLEELGRGGMGVVYKARQKGLKRLVALKMILDSALAGSSDRERFRLEAESTAHLQHPNIVQIHEIGEHEGRPFFSLEYVDGGSLKERLAGTPLPPLEAARLAETLARAIAYAHQQGVIHRDLKPANVLLASKPSVEDTTRGLLAMPKIADFGLAKQIDDDSGQTRTGAIIGTPSYMAPEQATGQTDAVGPLSDVYALGVILYEMLTGRPPFRAASVLETLDQVRTREPVPPAHLQASVPRDLDTICLKCLHKEPRKRYSSAIELADDLRRFLDGRPILARPIGPLARLVRWGRRNPTTASLLATLAVVIVVAFGLVTWKWREALDLARRETQARAEEQAAKERARKEGNEARRRSAQLLLERALSAANDMEIDQALFWLTDGLAEAIKAEDAELEQALRLQIGAWSRSVPVRRGYLPYSDVRNLACDRDGKVLALETRPDPQSSTGIFQLWDAVANRPIRKPIHLKTLLGVLALSPDGATVLTAADTVVEVGEVWTGETRFTASFPRTLVSAAAFSPDSKLVLVGTTDGKSYCLDALTGKQVGPSLSQPGSTLSIALSPEGKRAITVGKEVGSGRSVLRLWEVPSFQSIGEPLDFPSMINVLAFVPNGEVFLTGHRDGKVQFWSSATARAIEGTIIHGERVSSFAIHPKGRILATGGLGARQHLLRPGSAGGQPSDLSRTLLTPPQVDFLAFSPDGRTLLAAGAGSNQDGGQLRLWKTGNRQSGPPLRLTSPIARAYFLAGGRTLAAYTVPGEIALWQLVPEIQIGEIDPSEHSNVVFTLDGQRVLSNVRDQVQLWDGETGRPIGEPLTQIVHRHLAITPDGRWFGVIGKDYEGILVGFDGTRLSRRVLAHPGKGQDAQERVVTDMVFSADGRLLATGSADGWVQLWDVASGRALGMPLEHETGNVQLLFSPDNRFLFANSASKAAFKDFFHGGQLWNVATATPGPYLDVPVPCAGAFSPDGKTIYIGAYKGQILSRKVETGEPAGPAISLPTRVQCLALSADGTVLLAGCLDGTARAWRTDTWQPIGRVLQDSTAIVTVALSHDGRLALTGAMNQAARLWDVQLGRPLDAPYPVHVVGGGVGFSGDGKRILLAARDGVVRVYPVPVPVPGSVERVRRWIEVITGTEMGEHDSLRPLDRKTWEQRQHELVPLDSP